MRERNTIQKFLVLEAARQLDHPTAEQVYAFVRNVFSNISRATVYRNLGNQVEAGELRKVTVSEGADHFDRRLDSHYHIRCRNCGMVADVRLPYQKELLEKVSDTGGYLVEDHDILFGGICPACQAREANNV